MIGVKGGDERSAHSLGRKFLFYFVAAWLSPQREEKEAQLDEGGSGHQSESC